MHRRQYLATLASVAGAGLAGCSGGGASRADGGASTPEAIVPEDGGGNTATPPSEETVDISRGESSSWAVGNAVEAREFGWIDEGPDFRTPGVVGVVENISNQRLAEVTVEVEFYDENTQIGINTSWISFLATGEYGTIEVPYSGDESDRVTRVAVTVHPQFTPITPVNDGEIAIGDVERRMNEDGLVSATGTIENTLGEPLETVAIYVNFYRSEELLGEGSDVVRRLGIEERAEWEVVTGRTDGSEITRHSVVATVRR